MPHLQEMSTMNVFVVWPALLEVVATGSQMKCAVNLNKNIFDFLFYYSSLSWLETFGLM